MTKQPTYVSGHKLLEGKTVLVTAAAGTGIGFATALRCAEEGASGLVISDIHERRLGEAADKIEAETGMRPETVMCNVTKEDEVQAMFELAVDKMGHVDVLMNNAGLGGYAKVVDMTDVKVLAPRDGTTACRVGSCLARVDETDRALEWLGIGIEKGFTNHRYLGQYERLLAPIRDDPRFEALMERAREKERALVV